jgi:hypothetical protein
MVSAIHPISSNFAEKPSFHIRVNLKNVAYGPLCSEQQREPSMLSQSAISAAVIGPDGRNITLADLPSPGIKRWVTRRKAEVVAAVRGGLLTEEDACRRYELTKEEFGGWERLYERHGVKGLRTTRLQNYR